MSLILGETVGEQLRGRSHLLTDWKQIGVAFDDAQADMVIQHAPEDLRRPYPDDETSIGRERRAASPACKDAARQLLQPLIDQIFAGDAHAEARENWKLFGVNYYEQGQWLPPHCDAIVPQDTTAIIASLSGMRILNVDEKPPVDFDLETKLPSVDLRLGRESLVLIDCSVNPSHSARCKVGPSISVVAEVPALPYL